MIKGAARLRLITLNLRLRRFSAAKVQLTNAQKFSVFWTRIAVIDVIRVFPHVNGQQRFVFTGQRGGRVGGVDDCQRAVRFFTSRSSLHRSFSLRHR